MGTYTTNKNLFMPTVGEQGWGELVNGNFETIDTFLKPISLSGNTYTFTGNLVGNQSGGTISATSITNSGTLTNTGKITANGGIGTTTLTTSSTITSTGLITANGGIKGNLTGNVTGNTTGFLFVKGTVGTYGDVTYATCPAISNEYILSNSGDTSTITIPNYSISYGNPVKHGWGVYTRRSDLSGTTSPSLATRNVTVTGTANYGIAQVSYYNASNVLTTATVSGGSSSTFQVKTGTTFTVARYSSYGSIPKGTITIPAGTTYYVKYATP